MVGLRNPYSLTYVKCIVIVMDSYFSRVADDELAAKLRSVGAVLIEGPKACGKTDVVPVTALRP